MVQTNVIAAARLQLSDDDLMRLRAAARSSPDVVPGLLAYLDYSGDWEQHRRRGVDLAMQGPTAAMEDTEVDRALLALQGISARFGATGHVAVASLFHAVAYAIRPAPPDPGQSLH